jgi:hypothetical protein
MWAFMCECSKTDKGYGSRPVAARFVSGNKRFTDKSSDFDAYFTNPTLEATLRIVQSVEHTIRQRINVVLEVVYRSQSMI